VRCNGYFLATVLFKVKLTVEVKNFYLFLQSSNIFKVNLDYVAGVSPFSTPHSLHEISAHSGILRLASSAHPSLDTQETSCLSHFPLICAHLSQELATLQQR